MFWLLHSDLHEVRAAASLEYMSSMKATVEQMVQPMDGKRVNSENLSLMEHNLRRGKFRVNVKRRNGRVRMMVLTSMPPICLYVFISNNLALEISNHEICFCSQVEEISVENSAIKFTPVSSTEEITAQSLVPKVG